MSLLTIKCVDAWFGWHTRHPSHSLNIWSILNPPALLDTLANASIHTQSILLLLLLFISHLSFLSYSYLLYSIQLISSFLFFVSYSLFSLFFLHIFLLPLSDASTDTDTDTHTDTDSAGLMTGMGQKWWTWLPSITLKMTKDFSVWTFWRLMQKAAITRCCTVLHCTVLYCTVLYCTVRHCGKVRWIPLLTC